MCHSLELSNFFVYFGVISSDKIEISLKLVRAYLRNVDSHILDEAFARSNLFIVHVKPFSFPPENFLLHLLLKLFFHDFLFLFLCHLFMLEVSYMCYLSLSFEISYPWTIGSCSVMEETLLILFNDC